MDHTDNCSGEHDIISGACVAKDEDGETVIGRQTREFMQAVAPSMAEPKYRTILAHLNITLPIDDKRTEAEITAALEGIIEVGNDERWVSGTSRRYLDDITITLVEEI